jgi:beta propeller repeat protein
MSCFGFIYFSEETQMTNRIFAFITVVLVLFSCAESAIGIHANEMEICTDAATQANPCIEYNFIIWQDNRNGNWDIYGYDLHGRRQSD